MDFSNLAIAPIAGLGTAATLVVAYIAKRYREPRSLLTALLAAFTLNTFVFEPWHYLGWKPLLTEFVLLSMLGFCIGSLTVLVPAKAIAALRRHPT